jgi:hypothetical protein
VRSIDESTTLFAAVSFPSLGETAPVITVSFFNASDKPVRYFKTESAACFVYHYLNLRIVGPGGEVTVGDCPAV